MTLRMGEMKMKIIIWIVILINGFGTFSNLIDTFIKDKVNDRIIAFVGCLVSIATIWICHQTLSML